MFYLYFHTDNDIDFKQTENNITKLRLIGIIIYYYSAVLKYSLIVYYMLTDYTILW